ncbi:MAG: putative fatty acid oxidation complex alpha subunit [Pseudonocardiales bacterium]|nr:putative fatty acid oxidation complex alpha subunit [Pseudonocardiales bacterium]
MSEVITHALVRYIDVPGLDGQLALITLDNGHDHTRPSTFGPAGIASLDAALDDIAARSVVAVAVTGKPFVFAVGADLGGVAAVSSRAEALAFVRLGHRVFRRFKDSAVPTFAFVNGAVMGGGLELALHCHYRTLSSSAAAIAFPECFLGLVPGWGGTQLLPNLIGAEAAVKVIIDNPLNQNKMLSVAQAVELGLTDVVFDGADFLAESLRWAVAVVNGEHEVTRPQIDRGDAWTAALKKGRAIADGRVHGAAPAPYRALELIELARTGDFTAGTAAEDEALADLVMTDELRAGLYAFDLVQRRAKKPAGAPDKSLARSITKVGVVGAGLMAGQMALLFARRLKVPVVLTDVDQARLDKGVAYVHGEIATLAGKGRISMDEANRLTALVSGSLSKAAFADADFVIEAVFEEMGVKQQVLAELEEHVSPEAVLATNTSSLSVTEMSRHLAHPERVVGFHFFNPVAVMPLVEIVRTEASSDPAVATAFAIGKSLGKSCVLVKDAPSFVVNRLLTRFMGVVTHAVDTGTPIEIADNAVAPLGLPMTPFQLLGLVGPAVALHVSETLHQELGDRFTVSENLRRVVEAKKTQLFIRGNRGPVLDPDVLALFQVGDDPSTEAEVCDRAVSALAEEIRMMLDEGVVASPAEIDLCMILGAGWPFHLGGITPYLDRSGASERATGQRFLPPGVASVPA